MTKCFLSGRIIPYERGYIMKTKINITIDQNTLVKTDNEARACDMSRSEFVNSVLNDWFTTKDYIKNSMPEILKGIEDIKFQLSKFNIEN